MTLEHWVAAFVGTFLLFVAARSFSTQSRQTGNPLSARGLFSLVWGLALVLFAIPIISYTPVPLTVWMFVYGSVASFLVGTVVGQRSCADPLRSSRQKFSTPIVANRLRLVWLFFAFLGLLGFSAYVYAVNKVLGWTAILETPDLARDIQTTSVVFSTTYGPFKFLTYAGTLAFLLWTLGVRNGVFCGPWTLARFLGPLSLMPFLFTGDRALIIGTIVWVLLFNLLLKPPRHVKRLLLFLAGLSAGLVSLFVVLGARVSKTLDAQPEIIASLNTRLIDPLILPYVYITGNIPTLAGLIQDPIAVKTDGKFLVLPFIKVLSGIGLPVTPPEVVGAFYPIPFETFNNYSWLGYLYSDFGFVGSVVFLFGVGLGSTLVVNRAIQGNSLLTVWMGSLLLYGIAFSPLLPKLTDTLTWLFALAGLVIAPALNPKTSLLNLGRLLSVQFRKHPFVAVPLAAVGMLILVSLVAGSYLFPSKAPPPQSPQELSADLRRYGSLASKTIEDNHFPSATALASRLRVNNPKIRFVHLVTPGQVFDPQAVGVFTEGRTVLLVARSSSGKSVIRYSSDGGPGILKVVKISAPLIDRNLLKNSAFSEGFRYWEREAGDTAVLNLNRDSNSPIPFGLKVNGTGKGGTAALVMQWDRLQGLPSSCFQFRTRVRTKRLSRDLTIWAQFFGSTGQPLRDVISFDLRRNVIRPWVVKKDSVSFTEPIEGIRVFAVDTGQAPFSGSYWIDHLSLKRTC